jgi:hypothetical protein
MRLLAIAVLAASLAACDRPAGPAAAVEPAATPAGSAPAPAADYAVTAWPLPSPTGAAQPDLVGTPGGDLLLSWIEPAGDGHVLKFARWSDGDWSAPQPIASGDDWFVNWADTPHIAVSNDGALWAHWLQKSAAATYAYDVALVRSDDGGKRWSQPVLVNTDGTPTEHGFVSLWPAGDSGLGVAWLDGRETGGGHGGHGGAMTLRTARFDAQLQRHDEFRLDAMTCDCCQTDIALTARGPVLAYRDRTQAEIRDVAVTRLGPDGWSESHRVHADNWKMPACPVNGPAIAADGEHVVVGWYTAAGGMPTVKLARSTDAGDSFAAPVVLDRGVPVQGRVDVALTDDAAWVLWTREDDGGQSLQLARYTPDLARELQRVELAQLQGRGRGTGFARLVATGDDLRVAWTDIVDGKPQLQGAQITVNAR